MYFCLRSKYRRGKCALGAGASQGGSGKWDLVFGFRLGMVFYFGLGVCIASVTGPSTARTLALARTFTGRGWQLHPMGAHSRGNLDCAQHLLFISVATRTSLASCSVVRLLRALELEAAIDKPQPPPETLTATPPNVLLRASTAFRLQLIIDDPSIWHQDNREQLGDQGATGQRGACGG